MADELFNEEVFTLTDEEGNEKQFELLGSQEIDGNTYLALVPVEDNENEEYVILKVEEDENGEYMLIHCEYDPLSATGDVNASRKVKGTLHWADAKTAVPAKVRMYDYLLKEFDGVNKDFMDRLNENSLEVLDAFIEPQILKANAGDRFQFMRMGYFCADEKEFTPDNIVINKIVSLKDSFAKAMK